MSMQFPNGVIIDGENNMVTFPVSEALTLKFTFEEWMEFVSMVADANLVFESNTSISTYMCNTCGTVNAAMEFEEPKDEDLN